MENIAIEIDNLSFKYSVDKYVLKDVSFNIPEKSIVTIVGKNGIGKTTLLNCVLGLTNDYTGTIRLLGKEQSTYTKKQLSHVIGFVPQLSQVYFDYTVEEFVLMGGTSSLHYFSLPSDEIKATAEKVLDKIGLYHLKDRSINSLSGGERQLAYIARTLIQQPKIIVMDEPTSALDFGNSLMIINLIKELKDEGYTIVLTCHDPDYPFVFHDYTLAMMPDNKMVFGKSEEILSENLLSKIYGVNIKRYYISKYNQYVCLKGPLS